MRWIWVLSWVAFIGTTSSTSAQGEAAFAGVYAVRRVVTSSTCPGTSVDGVLANVYMMSIEPSASRVDLTVVVSGTRRFPLLRGRVIDGTLHLTASDGEGGSVSVALVARSDGTLAGTETVTLGPSASQCTIVRRVTASPVAESRPPPRHG